MGSDTKSTLKERLKERLNLAHAKVLEHGLSDWSVSYDRARARAGACHYSKKRITLSKYFARSSETTDEAFMNTVLHEIAHAKAGAAAGHGPQWKEIAISIGCDGKRCIDMSFASHKYHVTCGCGALSLMRHKKTRRLMSSRCSKCNGPVIVAKHRV